MVPVFFSLMVLISLIAVAFVLRKLRDEHMNLRAVVVGELNTTVDSDERNLTELQAQLRALEKRLKEEEEVNGEPRPDVQYNAVLRALATLLHQHEVGSSEISGLLEKLPEVEREKFLAELKATDAGAGHATLWSRVDEIEAPETTPEEPTEPAPEPEPPTEPAPESPTELVPEAATEPAPAHGSELPQGPGDEVLQDSNDYIVQTGDTLTKVSRIYKVSLASLIRANEIANPDLILIGQVLKIPLSE